MAFQLPCSSCGGAVPFPSKALFCAVCPYCGSMLVRKDLHLESLGQVALLQDDYSPLQIGSEGSYGGKSFVLTGRIRRRWAEGAWNEWFMDFGDEGEAWLAEAQGFYSVSRPSSLPKPIPTLDQLQVGTEWELGNKRYQVDDRREAKIEGIAGQLPFLLKPGEKSVGVDFSGPDGRFATLEFAAGEARLYVGEYLELPDLRMKNLRELDGW